MKRTPRAINNGLIIVFEGIDGAGKTTQLELARDALAAEGWQVQVTRNLGGTPIGEALRKVIKAPFKRPAKTNLYISVAIQEALVESMRLARAKSEIILMDRGPISLAAYEIYGGGLDQSLGWQHVDEGMAELGPELTILYGGKVETAMQRLQNKPDKADYFESQPLSFFKRVAEGYAAAAKRYPGVTSVNGDLSINAVHEQTMLAIHNALDKKTKA